MHATVQGTEECSAPARAGSRGYKRYGYDARYRPGAHGAVGAALACQNGYVSVSDVIVHLFFNHCMNSLCTIIDRL